MVVYGTYRPEDLHDVEGEQAPLVEVIQFMSREKLFTHTLLERLTKDEVAQLVRSFLGRDDIPDSFIDPINENFLSVVEETSSYLNEHNFKSCYQ